MMKRVSSIITRPLPMIILILIIGISSIGCRNYPQGGSGDEIIGIGVMGDSNSD